ncbi:MAG: hypothetical protein JJ974_10990 [Phycisphaerales bacterium]|nr:hypothetical protein [Phycisphaerales bacterium]
MPLVPNILKDPQLGLPKKERAAILKHAANRWFSKPSNIVLYVCITVFWCGLMLAAGPLADSLGIHKALSTALIWGVLYPLMFIFSYWVIFNYNFLPFLYKELRTRQHDVCPRCGYILFTLPESNQQCPECGTQREPLPDPKPEPDSKQQSVTQASDSTT